MTTEKHGPWSEDDLAVLCQEYPHHSTAEIAARLGRTLCGVYGKAASLALHKSAEYLNSPAACRLRRGDGVGARTRFKKGQAPFNKGQKGWSAGGRSIASRFKPGARPQTWVPIGTETHDRDGYLKRKIADDAPAGASRFNWKFVHVLVWEAAHGPVPTGHAVIFRDNNKRHITLENLELIPRQELMRRNTIHRYPPPLKQTIRLVGKLKRTIEAIHEKQN